MAAQRRPVFHVIDGGAQLCGRHPSLEEPVVRVLQPLRHCLFGLAQFELVSASPVAKDGIISLPFAGSFGSEAVAPSSRQDGTYRVHIEVGGQRVSLREISISQNWLCFRVGHPDGACMSTLLQGETTVFLYWVGKSGEENAMTFQIWREG